ncbi:sarcosine oxidase subunit gamma [Minwuia sp.]|uniref:sarcosine oxidase subunit gamma n=1 Tax=Minwuia sp. TaxID=2493630 RepID=UPI003A90ACF7
MNAPVRRSPLAHREPISCDALRLRENPFEAKLILRAQADACANAVKAVTGAALPVTCRLSQHEDITVAWLSPDEFLILGAEGSEQTLHARLTAELGDSHHLISNVTDYYTTLTYSGARAREALMKLSTLDLHPRGFTAGDVKGSVFMHANAWLMQRLVDDAPDGPSFDLIVRWSFADYLWCALAHAGREWGLPEQNLRSGETLVI